MVADAYRGRLRHEARETSNKAAIDHTKDDVRSRQAPGRGQENVSPEDPDLQLDSDAIALRPFVNQALPGPGEWQLCRARYRLQKEFHPSIPGNKSSRFSTSVGVRSRVGSIGQGRRFCKAPPGAMPIRTRGNRTASSIGHDWTGNVGRVIDDQSILIVLARRCRRRRTEIDIELKRKLHCVPRGPRARESCND